MNQTPSLIRTFNRNDKISVIGLVLILFLLTFSGLNLEIVSLSSLQKNEVYKQLTGALLLGFILYQWYFALARQIEPVSAMHHLQLHKTIGLLMPILLFIHSNQTGHAYQTFIWYIFVLHCSVGFLNPEFINIKKPRLRLYWFILHIGLSILISALLFFHLYVVYYYT